MFVVTPAANHNQKERQKNPAQKKILESRISFSPKKKLERVYSTNKKGQLSTIVKRLC